MALNSCSSTNSSTFPIHPPYYCFIYRCFISKPSSYVFISFTATNILVFLPLCVFILYIGNQRRKQQLSGSTADMTTHADIFAYHAMAMEMIGSLWNFFCSFAIHFLHPDIFLVGFLSMTCGWFGSTFLHILTCVARYLAVVHPVTYLGLKMAGGIRIRNISIGCAWMHSIGLSGLVMHEQLMTIMDLFLIAFTLMVTFFCSVSVLCVLIRPGPGEGRDRVQVNQSKRKAFHTIMAVVGTLLLRFALNMVLFALEALEVVSYYDLCVMMACLTWFNMPSNLVLPLLFLHRAGKLHCFKS